VIPGHFRLGRLDQAAGGCGGRGLSMGVEWSLCLEWDLIGYQQGSEFCLAERRSLREPRFGVRRRGYRCLFFGFLHERTHLECKCGAHRRVELECWLRSVNEVAPFSCSPADLLRSELLDQDHRAPAVWTQPGSGQPGLPGGGCGEILTRAGLQQLCNFLSYSGYSHGP
jgi:hypothetical protein